MGHSVSMKWFIRSLTILVIFLCIYVFLKLTPIWKPVFNILVSIFIPLFISSFITYLLLPIVEGLHRRGIPRTAAILGIYIIFFGGIGFGLYKLYPQIIKQLKDLNENLPALMNTYRYWIETIDARTEHFPEEIHARIEKGLSTVEQSANEFITNVLKFLWGLLNSLILFALVPLIVFYMLKDIDVFKKTIWYITPRKWRRPGIELLKEIDESLGNYIRGQLFVSIIIGIVATFSLWLVGMSYPLILGTIIGITNIIPYFGPIIGAIPSIIVASTISIKMVIIVAIIVFCLQFIEGNILSPLIVGKSLHMHPVVIIVVLLAGEEVGGMIGLILAVPIIAVLRVVLTYLKRYMEKEKIEKN
ncbi:AI-2E family transporter [Calidifontibacillus erzurumensis]|uniref:AI-2E family transporter n=1 Tax=Calidifontibacillus erzurumensis TaxID=2741433 RepID=UPI0035B4FD4D